MSDYQNDYNNENLNDAYKAVIEPKSRSKAWSVAALIVSIASVMCCCFGWFGFVAGVLGIIFAVVSRKTLGYFDGLSVTSIIISIFGVVFSVLILYVSYILENDPEFMELYEEFLRELEALENSDIYV